LRWLSIIAAVVTTMLGGHALAQDYPARTITIVVPYPPGGGVDSLARIIAEKLSTTLGQQVIVDNRAGGSGLVGTRGFIKSAPDGYTLFLGHTGPLSINPSLYANSGFDPRKDFAPIGLIGNAPNSLVVHPSFPAKTIAELIAYAKANPGKVNFGSAGAGTASHITGEYFGATAGIKLVHAELIAALARAGIERFSPDGERFDPQLHEAMAQQPAEGAEPGTVIEVYQRGYRLGDSVIRPARVVVAG